MIVLGIVLIILNVGIVFYNRLVYCENKVEESLSGIDVSLARRYDLLNNLQETVKGQCTYEKETLLQLVNLRKNMSIEEKSALNQSYEKIQNHWIALSESYPDLKANEGFIQLQKALVECENHIQASRRFYNANVSIYNQKISSFPYVLFASICSLEKKAYFIATEQEKETVKIEVE